MANRVILLVVAFCLLLLQCPPASLATRLSADTRKTVQEIYPAGNVRMDGSVELPDHNFLLPLVPGVNPLKKLKLDNVQKFPADAAEPDLIIYKNGWAHLKADHKSSTVTLVSSQQTDTVGVLDTTTLDFTKQVEVGHTTQGVIWLPAG